MNATKEERLSALADDEAQAFEVRRLVDELERDPELLARWSRYHLMGDLLRDRSGPLAPPDFSRRIMQAIEEEEVLRAGWWVRHARLARPAAGMAMAAVVAAAVLLGVQSLSERPGGGGVPVAGGEDPDFSLDPADGGGFRPAAKGQPSDSLLSSAPEDPDRFQSSPIERVDAHMGSYLLNHTESAMARNLSPYTPASGNGFASE